MTKQQTSSDHDSNSNASALSDHELDGVTGGAVHQATAVGHRNRHNKQHDICTDLCKPYSLDTQAYPSSGAATKG